MSDINMGDEPLELTPDGLREVFEFIESDPREPRHSPPEETWEDHQERIEQARRAEELHAHKHEPVRADFEQKEAFFHAIRDAIQEFGDPFARATAMAERVLSRCFPKG